MSNSQNDRKGQTEHNKAGHQPATQRNEPKRTPESRSDRESQVGAGNQSQARRGPAPGGH
ncbi:hypothetical protein [Variovorax guangxiensis]|uniref:hypothetical protein n=1 Tax=Variovorax guangxiensis TaxID=1775474 RepID=UPI0028577420|nr:hypothetical protein [Variovorax guangxiensis]MDR6860047.1 hypothetical protein [Variovorax guangxiensis]